MGRAREEMERLERATNAVAEELGYTYSEKDGYDKYDYERAQEVAKAALDAAEFEQNP